MPSIHGYGYWFRSRRIAAGGSPEPDPDLSAPTDIRLSGDELETGDTGSFATLFMVGGVEPGSFSLTTGPGWLSLVDGQLQASGAQGAGTHNFTLSVTDAAAQTLSDVAKSITVLASPIPIIDQGGGGVVVPDPNDPETEPGQWVTDVVQQNTSDGLKVSGKNSGTTTWILTFIPLPAAGESVLISYTADYSGLKRRGREAAVGFAFKSGNDYHLVGVRGNGSNPASMVQSQLYGDFRKPSQFVITSEGTLSGISKDGETFLRITRSADGEMYTLEVGASEATLATVYVDELPTPLSGVDAALEFGVGAYFTSQDSGVATITVKQYVKSVLSTDPVWLPEGATVYMDFVNGHYYANGAERTLAEVLEPAGFDPAAMTAQGMQVTYANQATHQAQFTPLTLESMYTAMDNGFAVVVEMELVGVDSGAFLFTTDTADPNVYTVNFDIYGSEGNIWGYDDGTISELSYNHVFARDLTGITRFAHNFFRPQDGVFRTEFAANSEAEVIDPILLGATSYGAKALYPSQPLFARIGDAWGTRWDFSFIRKLEIYPAVSPAGLAVLAAQGLPLEIISEPEEEVMPTLPYEHQFVAKGGKPPYNFSLQSGTLPDGLSLSSGGLLSGTPDAQSSYPTVFPGLAVRVTDADGEVSDYTFSMSVVESLVRLVDDREAIAILGNSNSASKTVNLGTPHPSRLIAVVTLASFNVPSSATIDGQAMEHKSNYETAISWKDFPDGETASVTFSRPGLQMYAKPFVYATYSLVGRGPAITQLGNPRLYANNTSFANLSQISSPRAPNQPFFWGHTFHNADWSPDPLTDILDLPNTSVVKGTQGSYLDSGGSRLNYASVLRASGTTEVGGVGLTFLDPDDPYEVWAREHAYGGGNHHTVDMTGNYQAGDILIAQVMHRSALTRVPGGWSLIGTATCTMTGVTEHDVSLYARVANGAEGIESWRQTTNARFSIRVMAFRSPLGRMKVLDFATASQSSDTTQSHLWELPSVVATADNQLVVTGATAIAANTGGLTTGVMVDTGYFDSATANWGRLDHRMHTGWTPMRAGEGSSGAMRATTSSTAENGIAAVAALLGQAALQIDGAPVQLGEVGVAYAGFTVTASGGTGPYTYTVQSGSLPAGLSLNSSTGVLSGTPTNAGYSEDIVIRVTDSLGATADLAAFTMAVTDGPLQVEFIGGSISTTTNATINTSFGAEHATRLILVTLALGHSTTLTTDLGGVNTIGGVTARQLGRANPHTAINQNAAIFVAHVPTGASGDVVLSSAHNRTSIAVYRIVNARDMRPEALSTRATTSSTTTGNTAVTASVGDAVIGVGMRGSATAWTPTGDLTVNYSNTAGTNHQGRHASLVVGTAGTINFGHPSQASTSLCTVLLKG